MKIIFIIVVLVNITYSQISDRFSLLGTTWLCAKGQNHKIFPSVTNSIPTHLIKITFPTAYDVKSSNNPPVSMSFATLMGREYSCTADFIEDAVSQLNSPHNTISNTDTVSYFSINYKTIYDTVYSCEESFRKTPGYAYYKMNYNGDEITYYPGAINEKKWHKNKPVAWGAVNRDSRNGIYTIEDDQSGRYYKDIGQQVTDDGWIDYCDNEYCYERINCTDYKVVSFSFWQVHLFPVVKWFPRDIFTGKPILNDNLVMDLNTAQTKKQESINNPDNVELKYHRNPYFSDSASCVISFQFIDNTVSGDLPLYRRDYISTQHISEKDANNPINFDHIPGRIVRVKTGMSAIENAILRLYAEDSLEDAAASTVYSRCSYAWQFIDKEVGKKRYPPLLQKQGEPLIMDTAFSEKRYSYNGCPCLELAELNNFTAAEIRGFVYQAPPLCSVKDMSNAMYIYQKAFIKLNNSTDRAMIVKRIITVHASLIDRIGFYEKNKLTAKQIDKYSQSCPKSWIKYFPSYRDTYTDELKSQTERLISIVQQLKSANVSIDTGIEQIASTW